MRGWEPSYDYNRWMSEGVLSLLYQPLGSSAHRNVMSILEWDARAYFASIPEPASVVVLALAVGTLVIKRRRPQTAA
jgi:hypothetical protein